MRYGFVESWRQRLRRRWLAGMLLFLAVAGVGSALVLLSHPVYRAEARLRLGDPPPMSGMTSPGMGLFGLLGIGGDPFSNDLELLASRTLAERVVDDAVLHVRLDAPRGWHRDSLLTSLRAGRATQRVTFSVAWTGADVVITPESGGNDPRPVRGPAGSALHFGDVTAVFRPWREGMPRRIELSTVPHGQAARELGEQLAVERTRRDANVIRVQYDGGDPRLTRDVVAAAVEHFITLRTQLMQRESGVTVDSLRGVAERTQQELVAAETSLEALQRTTGLIAPEAQAEVSVERYAELIGQLETARMELGALTQALARSAASDDAAGSWAALLAYPRFLANTTVGEMLTTLTELEQRRRELARRRTQDNAELRSVTEQISHLDRSLRTIAVDLAAGLADEVDGLERRAAAVRADLATVPASTIELGRRHRDLRIFTEMVVLTEQRLRQEELRQAFTFANVQVIDVPAVRDRPVWPRLKLGVAVALLIAAGTAVFGMVVIDRADGSVRTAAQVRDALGTPAVAVVTAQGAAPAMPAEDAAAIIRRAAVESSGSARLVLVDAAGGRSADLVAGALERASALDRERDGDGLARPCIEVLPAAAGGGAAAAAAARRVPVFVVVEMGSTTVPALERTAGLLRQAGADLTAAVLVCRSSADADGVWA
ncbi:MAG: hypothetical protein WEF86_16650 [Gemmatimonadota bacterium]